MILNLNYPEVSCQRKNKNDKVEVFRKGFI